MRGTIGEFLIDRLITNGVEHCFGIPGDYNLNFYNKLYKSKVKVIGTTCEASAGYAADAYARVKGIGCICVTYCVGGFNIVNAVACAYAEKSPVVVISGSPGLKERDDKLLLHHMVGHFECQHKMFENITCANTVLRDPSMAGYEIDRVLTAAHDYKQPVYIELPRDMVDKAISYDPYTVMTPKEKKSDEHSLAEAVQEAVNWINSASRPVIWAGVECARFGLAKKLIKFAEHNNIPVATTVLGKSVVNERNPLSLGVYCEGTARDELREFMDECDCLIMLGVMMTDTNTGFLPVKYQKRNTVRATTEQVQIRNHSFNDIKFVDFCDGLFRSKICRKPDVRLPKTAETVFSSVPNKNLTVQRLFEKINSIIDGNMAIIADVGDSLFGALDITVHDSHHFISDAFYTSMGFAVPAAIGVQSANSNVRPIILVGDGAFQMTGMEFSTLVRMKSNAIVFVLNNGGYGTERLLLDGQFNDIKDWNYDQIPVVVGGGRGFKARTEEELDRAVSEALASKEPSIINVLLDKHDHSPALKRLFSKVAKKC